MEKKEYESPKITVLNMQPDEKLMSGTIENPDVGNGSGGIKGDS